MKSKLQRHSDEGEVVNTDEQHYYEWTMKEESRNIELERELETRMKRREGYSDKDKVYRYTGKDRKEDTYHEDVYRDHKHREDRYRGDTEQAHRHRTGRAREDSDRKKRSRDHISSHRHTSRRDGSPFYDDRASRHKDNKDARRDNNSNKNRDEISEHRSCSIRDQQLSDKACVDDISARKRLKAESQLSPSMTVKVSSHLPRQPSMLGKPVDPTLGRSQTIWNNFPNWSYIPFHHVPPYNPYMYQAMPPMLGRPPMSMSHSTMPYHYTGGTEWNGQSLETNVVSVDSQSSVQKTEDLVHGLMDEDWSGLMGPQIENEEKNLDFSIPEVRKVKERSRVSVVGKDDNTLISRAYLSKIDVSKDLTRPELFDQITNMLDLDQESSVSDECDFKIMFLKQECVKDGNSNEALLYADVDDSVYKKAMSLYAKQSARFTAMGSQSVKDQEKESCKPSIGDCEVKVKDSCNNDDEVKDSCKDDVGEVRDSCNDDGDVKNSCNNDDGSKDGGSLLVLTDLSTSQLTEFGSVNSSQIHSTESIC